MGQPTLFRTSPRFDGATFDPASDQGRLTGQLERVYAVLRDGQWYTVQRISAITLDPEPSVSAQIRDLRKARFGGHTIARRYHHGVYQFRLVIAGGRPCGS